MKVSKLVRSILTVGFLGLLYYLWLPALSLTHIDGVMFIMICLIAVICNIVMWVSDDEAGIKVTTIGGACLVIGMAILLVGALIGSPLFNAGAMREQIGEVEEIAFDEMIKQIDTAQIPIVDQALADKQAEKKLGEDVALGSRVELGEAAIQEVNGEILFVVPLEHTGFFKWNRHKTTPGYITVSASNQNKVNYVTEVEGEKIQVRYSPSAYFGNDLKRHIRNQGYRTQELTEYTFEIDNTGRPYWVVTTYENTTLWGNGEATGVVIVDAQTGTTNWYGLGEIPEWVDVVQPQSFVEKQIDNWGTLVKGVFNFSNEDKIQKTDLTLTVYVDGKCHYFTGMTSVGSDESCVGFIMVNTRTKKSQICYLSGATERAAMDSAEGLVSDFGYVSTEPLPLNVNGIPTYVMALKDKAGLIKSYAMVNIANYSIAAKGDSLQELSRSYVQTVTRNNGTHVVGSDEAYSYTCEGIVSRISAVVEDGSTYYYLIVEGEDGKIFMAPYTVSDELSITREGDTIKITYLDDKNGTVDIVSFDNIAFATQKSEDQERRDKLDEEASVLESKDNQVVKVNPEESEEAWNNLTDEEKAKLIQEGLKEAK